MCRYAARTLRRASSATYATASIVVIIIFHGFAPAVFASTLPRSVNLNVPFTVQAPFANWDHTHEEACEEAAALMVNRYWDKAEIKNQKAEKIPPREAEEAIQDLVAFQKKRYGFFESTTAKETARFIKDKWGYAAIDLIENPTLAQIKRELAAGFPIIVPAAGRSLGNPHFKRPGPLYHMLVLKGYTADGWIITNDPGTRRGADYRYRPDVLLRAIHDWNGGKVDIGQKVMIVVRP